MKKVIISTLLVLVFAGYSLFQKFKKAEGDESGRVIMPSSLNTNFSTTPSSGSSTDSGLNTSSVSSTGSVGAYKDGTFTGPVTDAFYGNVQVQAVIKNGKISNVVFLQYPNDQRESLQINSQAAPWLSQEAVRAQTARVDIISGATQTSEAFIQSLSQALGQAQA